MASTISYISSVDGKHFYAYDIGHPVGVGGRNLRGDVLLIQTLLYIFYYAYGGNYTYHPPAGFSTLAINGAYTRETHLHLASFKQLMRQKGLATPADGKVDPMPARFRDRTPRGYHSVLQILNANCLGICETRDKLEEYWLHLPYPKREEFPLNPRLQLELAAHQRVDTSITAPVTPA